MKAILNLVLALSLLLNATYAFLYFKRPASPAPAGDIAPASAARPAGQPEIDAQIWASLQAKELPDLATRLRASGFPPNVVRAIVTAQVRESFAARRKALLGAADEAPFWKIPQRDPGALAAMRQLAREEQKALRDVLGDAEPDDPMSRLMQNRGLEFLPAEKAADVREVIREFEERRADLYSSGFSYMTDRDKITALEKEQHAAIARVLTPQELFEYDLRRSNTANGLREELAAFKPTEEEYRAIYAIRAAFDERFGQYGPGPVMTPEEGRLRSEAQKLMTQQIKAVLSPPRAAEYDRMTDYNYRRTSQLVARLELPSATTDQLYAVQKEYEQRRSELYRGAASAADRERIAEQMKTMQQEAIARVTPLLGGPRAVEAYRQYGGQWISYFVPRTPPTPRPAPTAPTAPAPRS